MGSTSLEAARLDMFHESWCNMVHIVSNRFSRASDEAKKTVWEEVAASLTEFLKVHEAILKKHGPFYDGSKVGCTVLPTVA